MIQLKQPRDSENEKALTFNDFKGVDFTSNPLQVAKNRAISMSNLIHDGENHKRPCWNELALIVNVAGVAQNINGVWFYIDESDNTQVIVHAGTRLYRIYNNDKTTDGFDSNSILTQYDEIDTTGLTISDSISYGIMKDNRLYLLCGSYLVYGSWDNGSTYEVREVKNDEDTYIPTTTINISAINSSIDSEVSYEQANLLSKYRKNKLVGESLGTTLDSEKRLIAVESGDVLARGDIVHFDTTISLTNLVAYDPNTPLLKITKTSGTVTEISYVLSEITPIKRIYTLYDYDDTEGGSWAAEGQEIWNENDGWLLTNSIGSGVSFQGTVNIINQIDSQDLFYIEDTSALNYNYDLDEKADNYNITIDITYATEQLDNVTLDGGAIEKVYKRIKNTLSLSGNSSLQLVDSSGNIKGAIELENATTGKTRITLFENYPPMVNGESNMIVTFEHDLTNYIDDCQFGALLNAQGGQYLFVSGNPNYPNQDWHSEYSLDDEIEQLSDFTYFPQYNYSKIGSSSDTIVGYTVLGDDSMVIHSHSLNGVDTVYKRTSQIDSSGIVTFPLNKTAIGEGMIARNTSANLLGDNIFLSRNGVYGLSLDRNITSSERFALDRSYFISKALKEESNLENAVGIAFNGRYYLSINGHCYVADSRFKNYVSTDMPDTFSYEWWYWDNVNARIFFTYNNELYFGTDEGQICKFAYDDFLSDKTYHSGGVITISDDIVYIDTSLTDLIDNLKDYDGIVIQGFDSDGNESTIYFEDGEDLIPLDFEVPIMSYNDGEFQLYHYTDDDGNKIPYSINVGDCVTFTAYFVLKNNVESSYTFVTNFNNPLFQKKITKLTVTPLKISDGVMNVNIRTRDWKEKDFDIDGVNIFDFEHTNFANFTFNTDDLLSSYTKKTSIKCNYAQITVSSDNDRDCKLLELVLTYKLTKPNKGVK